MDDLSALTDTLSGLAKTETENVPSAPGPGDVGPTASGMEQTPEELVTLPFTPELMGLFWDEVDAARTRVKQREDQWDTLLKEYLPSVAASGTSEGVKTNSHFRNVHTKIGRLFYRNPELQLTPKGITLDQIPTMNPQTGQPQMLTEEDVVTIKQEVLNQTLGRDGIKVNRLMDELLFDTLAWAGYGACKVGYMGYFKPVQKPVMGPAPAAASSDPLDPNPQPQQAPQIGPDGQPMMQTVMSPIFEEWYVRRISPKKLLFNADLRSTRFEEDATWIGMEFYMSKKAAMKKFKLTDSEATQSTEDDRIHKYDEDAKGGSKASNLVHGIEMWLKASLWTDEVHPQAICQLVLLENMRDKPVVWRPSPDQTFGQDGRLTEDSLIGFPIKVLNIRDLADSPYVPSDSAFTNNSIKELNTFRRQSVQLRDAAIGKYFYDDGAFDETDIDALENGDVGKFIAVKEGALREGKDKVFTTTAQVLATQDDWRSQSLLKQDIDETLGINSIAAGTPESTVRTATEIASVQTAVAGRNEKEQARTVDFYLDIARAVDQLLMRYATEDNLIPLVGEDGTRKLAYWNSRIISGKWMYDIAPDSQLKVDTAADRQQFMMFYNLAAPDPLFNRMYALRKLSRMFGQDPAKMVLNPQTAMMQPPHGGGPVNKHETDKSGRRPNEPGATDHRAAMNHEPPPGGQGAAQTNPMAHQPTRPQ